MSAAATSHSAIQWEKHSIAVIGADFREFENFDVQKDPRFRMMSIDQAFTVLRGSFLYRAVIWCAKGMDHMKKRRLEGIINDLRGPQGTQTMNIVIWDEKGFERKMNEIVGTEKESPALTPAFTPAPPQVSVSSPPSPPTRSTPQVSDFVKSLIARGLLDLNPPDPSKAPSKAALARKFYEIILGDRDKFLEILRYNGYSSPGRQDAMYTLYNARTTLKKQNPDLMERVDAQKVDHRRKVPKPNGSAHPVISVPQERRAQARTSLPSRIEAILIQLAKMERSFSEECNSLGKELAAILSEIQDREALFASVREIAQRIQS